MTYICIVLPFGVVCDVTSREEGVAFKYTVPSPWVEDQPDSAALDQGAVLFSLAKGARGEGPTSGEPANRGLVFDRGGGLFARLMRVHFEVMDEART